jgi:hypothetical protein
VFVDKEDDGIFGGIGPTQDGSDRSVAVFVTVADLKSHLSKIEKAGGKVGAPITELPNGMGSIAGFVDPAGNWIGLWQAAAVAADVDKPARRAKKAARKPAGAKSAAKKNAGKRTAKKPAAKKATANKAAAKQPAAKKAAKKRAAKRGAGKKKPRRAG